MVKSIGILLVTAVIVMIDVPSMLKNKQKKELVIYSVLLFIGVTFLILLAFEVKIPSPVELFSNMAKPFKNILQIKE